MLLIKLSRYVKSHGLFKFLNLMENPQICLQAFYYEFVLLEKLDFFGTGQNLPSGLMKTGVKHQL